MKITAQELRIGNLIYDDFDEVHIVEKIESQRYNDWNGSDPSLVVFSKLKDTYDGMYTCDVVSGIPLTPEWLTKFGARKLPHGYFIRKLKFTYERNELSQFVRFHYSGKVAYLQYVHQLQNLYFALTGKELQINI